MRYQYDANNNNKRRYISEAEVAEAEDTTLGAIVGEARGHKIIGRRSRGDQSCGTAKKAESEGEGTVTSKLKKGD